jgi:hypothetical protein
MMMLMIRIRRDEPNALRVRMAPIRVAEIGRYNCFSALTAAWISLSKRSHLMGKQRKEHPEDNVFVNKPFIEGFSDWVDSPEGGLWTEICDALEDLLKNVQLDAKQRQFIWPDANRLDLEQSVQRIHKRYPDFPFDKIEEFLIDWIEMGYAPENYSQAQLDELDRLIERWVADYMRRPTSQKKGKRTRHS